MTIDFEVNDLKHLNDIISRLRVAPMVSKVEGWSGEGRPRSDRDGEIGPPMTSRKARA